MSVVAVKSFIKWAGGKQQLLPELLRLVPASYGKYIDPFLGGGALYYALQPRRAILSDINDELINLYLATRDYPSSLINSVSKFANNSETFYAVRSKSPSRLSSVQRASRFLYLNKTCYNGLYRVNKNDQFNVPFANYKNRSIYDVAQIKDCSDVLKRAEIKRADFREILLGEAEKGDLIFLDPPYVPISKNSSFTKYTANPFSLDDHKDLAEIARTLMARGCYVIHTNSDHPLVYKFYAGFSFKLIDTKRSISCNGLSRAGKDLIVCSPNVEMSSAAGGVL